MTLTILTILADIAFGGMAWRLAKSLEANQATTAAILRELTQRVEKLEARSG